MAGRSAAVVGATGLVGGFLVQRLLGDSHRTLVRGIGRRPLALTHARFEQLGADLLSDGDWAAALAVDDVFCCLGTTIKKAGSQAAFRAVDQGAVVRVAEAARARGAGQFLVVSSLGANPASRVFYNRVKGEMERDVAALGFPSCSVLRPSLLLGPRSERRLGERLAELVMRPLGPLLGKYRPIHAAVVAAAMVHLAAEARPGFTAYESDRIAALAARASA